MNQRYLILDTETTGLDDPRVVEVAWLEVDNFLNILDEQSHLVDPEAPISASASATHGIVAEDVAEAPTMDELFSMVLTEPIRNVTQISHNVAYDLPLVENHIEVVRPFCTLRAARRLYPDAENHQLGTLKYQLQLPLGQQSHRAMGDVIDTYELLKQMLMDSEMTDLEEFLAEFSKPVFIEYVSFGKFKGKRFVDCPNSYLQWILSGNFDEDIVFTVTRVLQDRGVL